MKKRNNIFLHFLKPDNVELYALKVGRKNVDNFYKSNFHLMDIALRYSFLLTHDYCIIPPAFVIESDFNFELLKRFKLMFEYNKFLFPLRESSFYEFAKKKELEYRDYQTAEDKYKNYSLTNLDKISSELNVNSLINKKTKIGETSAILWNHDINNLNEGLFDRLLLFHKQDSHTTNKIIKALNFDVDELNHKAFVWQFVKNKLDKANVQNDTVDFYVHSILQNYYIRSNIQDSDLALLSNAPFVSDNFFIQPASLKYDYNAFDLMLQFLGVRNDIVNMPLVNLIEIKNSIEFRKFIEVFDFLIDYSENNLDKFKILATDYITSEKINVFWVYKFVLNHIFKGSGSVSLILSDTLRYVLLRKLKPLINFVDKVKQIGNEDSINLLFKQYLDEIFTNNNHEIVNIGDKLVIKQLHNIQFINSNIKFSYMENKFENSTIINSNFVEGTLNMWKSNNVEFDNNDIEILKLIDKHSGSKNEKEDLVKAVENVKQAKSEEEKKKPLDKLVDFFKANAGTIGKVVVKGLVFTYLATNGFDITTITNWFE
jgi:hypothetical protein